MIKLASPDIREEDIQQVIEVLRSGNLVQGACVKKLEGQLSEYTNTPYCSLVSSGTAALHLSLMALGIGKDDAVIVSAFTFPATANVVEVTGAEVILCDVDPQSYVSTPEALQQVIEHNKSKNIKAVILVHEFGYPAEIKQISEICKKHGLFLIEDAACAFGTIANGHHPGFYSDMACYSFHPRKAITTGEGGAVVSFKKKLMEKINCLKNHGIEYTNGTMDFVAAGLNYRMTDFQAALAIGQLGRFDAELAKRIKLAAVYYESLKEQHHIKLPKYHENHSWQSFMITLHEETDRTAVIEKLAEAGVQTNLGAQAINCLTYFKNKYGFNDNTAPHASYLYNKGLALPLYGKLNEADIEFICGELKKIK
jgi:perosamine synthetase